MEPTLYQFVLDQLHSGRWTYRQVADGSDVSRRTVEKIARREIADPGVSHVEKLARFFREQERQAA